MRTLSTQLRLLSQTDGRASEGAREAQRSATVSKQCLSEGGAWEGQRLTDECVE